MHVYIYNRYYKGYILLAQNILSEYRIPNLKEK